MEEKFTYMGANTLYVHESFHGRTFTFTGVNNNGSKLHSHEMKVNTLDVHERYHGRTLTFTEVHNDGSKLYSQEIKFTSMEVKYMGTNSFLPRK